MGRSVDYLRRATQVAYADASGMGYTAPWSEELDDFDYEAEPVFCESAAEADWESFKANIGAAFAKFYPSMDFEASGHGWEDETNIIARNKLVEVGLAEYCGLVSLSVRPRDSLVNSWYSDEASLVPLAERLAARIDLDKVLAYALGERAVLRRLGTFSNGEGVFERKAA